MTTAQLLVFLAVLAQVILTLVQYVRVLRARLDASKDESLDRARLAYDQSAWPLKPRLIANSIASQFEVPVLFYLAVVLAFVLTLPGYVLAVLAWVFVLSRIVHAVIHTGSNDVFPRLRAFLVGWAVVALMWVWLTVRVVMVWMASV